MENNHRIKINLLILGMIFAISTINSFMIFNFQGGSINKIEDRDPSGLNPPRISGYWTTNFIHIDGNWSHTVGNYSWIRGDGSWNSPYIIENVTIDASTSPTGSGIYIENSNNDYFIIRNCTVYNSGNAMYDGGIKLVNTSKGLLENNTLFDNGRNGIVLYNYCENNTISRNFVFNYGTTNQDNGIYVSNYCNNNTFSNNLAYNNTNVGIFLRYWSHNNTISGNTANNNWAGIGVDNYCEDNTITGNTANDNSDYGIYFELQCINNIISGNAANYGDYGIYLNDGVNDTTVSENYLYFNRLGAIGVRDPNSNDNILKKNILVSEDEIFIYDDATNTMLISNYYLTKPPSLFAEIVNQSYLKTEFIVYLNISSQCIGLDLSIPSIQMWWNGIIVPSNSIIEAGDSLYFISLNPIFVESKETPILLNMTISAAFHEDKYYETYLVLSQNADADDLMLIIILSIISAVLTLGVIFLLRANKSLKKKKKQPELKTKI